MASTEEFSLPLSCLDGARADVDLQALVVAHSSVLFRVAYSILRSRVEAEDVVQDAFVRVLEYRKNLTEVRDVRVWLVRIAWNLALDKKKRLRPQQMDDQFAMTLVAKDVPVDTALGEFQHVRSVLTELDRLPKVERNALLLSAVDELSIGEIALVIGRSESAVRALLSRARQRLRERLQKGGMAR